MDDGIEVEELLLLLLLSVEGVHVEQLLSEPEPQEDFDDSEWHDDEDFILFFVCSYIFSVSSNTLTIKEKEKKRGEEKKEE